MQIDGRRIMAPSIPQVRIAFLALLTLAVLLQAVPASAQDPSRPPSTGTSAEQTLAKGIVQQSPQYRAEVRKQVRIARVGFDIHDAIVNVEGDYAVVGVPSYSAVRSVTGLFYVNLVDREVVRAEMTVVDRRPDGKVRLAMEHDGETVFVGTVNGNGDVIPDPGFANTVSQSHKQLTGSGEVAAASSLCVTAVTTLCGTGGGIACYFSCGALGLVSGVGGIACAGVCGAIGSLGCTGAVNAICG